MKTIIAGSRYIADDNLVSSAIIESGFEITEVVSGGAQGVDASGETLAKLHGIPLKIFRADWERNGRAAGPIRNRQMAQYADALIAVWDGKSHGTDNMINEMKKLGKPVFVKIVKVDEMSEQPIFNKSTKLGKEEG